MRVLFVCSGNMVRSQIAEAYYNQLTHSRNASSAGTRAVGIDSASRRATVVMDEVGVSMQGHHSKQVTQKMLDWADRVILFPVADVPPMLAQVSNLEVWNVDDLGYGKDDSLEQDRALRDTIRQRVEKLAEKLP